MAIHGSYEDGIKDEDMEVFGIPMTVFINERRVIQNISDNRELPEDEKKKPLELLDILIEAKKVYQSRTGKREGYWLLNPYQ